jgi:lipopolysaccharide export system permease protein
VIKKLDALIIRSFIGPFFATFFISLFVLVMQFFWLYIDDLVGKGLDIITLLKLIWYACAFHMPLALPLALLLSSIMTFGNLGESFELVAIKSAGIPLVRFMRPLLIVTIFISIGAFFFSNNIIPIVNLKFNNLKYDVIVTKPAFDIKEGVFYDKIDGFIIKIGKKEKDDSTIRNVLIYEKNYGLQDNVIVAPSGVMRVSADKKNLEFLLKDGWRYSEKGNRVDPNTEYTRLGFKSYLKVLDLGSFKMNKTEDSLFRYDPKMLSVRQLNLSIDSLNTIAEPYPKKMIREQALYLPFVRYWDSSLPAAKPLATKIKEVEDFIPDSVQNIALDRAAGQISGAKTTIDMIAANYSTFQDTLTKHWLEWHRKFTLSVACIVLFMIGAPLGSIIRKGGLGTPLLFAIIFFVLFHLLNTFGEKLSKEMVWTPFAGMWLSTLVLIPIGLFLTVKAMRDSELFNKEFYHRMNTFIKTKLAAVRQKKSTT